jgi:hypothetical protein
MHFSGIELARFIVPGEIGDLLVLFVTIPGLHACRQSFRAGSDCYTSKDFYPVALGSVFVGHFSGRTTVFFSTRKVAELAKSLAQDMAKRYPPAIANSPAQVVSQQRLSEILEKVFTRATEFSREHKLGWYKRIRLGKNFRWELNELGYDEKFVDTATDGLILCVSRNPSLKT